MQRGRLLRRVVSGLKNRVIGDIDSILRRMRNVLLNISFEVVNVIPYLRHVFGDMILRRTLSVFPKNEKQPPV
jgi:hypothetical protein